MARKMTGPPPAPPGAKGGDPGGRKAEGKLAGIFKRNPATALGVGGAGVVVVVALMMRGRGSATDPAASSDQLQGFRGGVYDSTQTDMYNQFSDMIKGLQDQIAGLKPPPPSGSTTPPKPPPKPAPKPTPKPGGTGGRPPSTHSYTIRRGDTLSAIASRAHISMSTLRKYNPTFWSNPKYHSGNLIWAGGHVKLPGSK